MRVWHILRAAGLEVGLTVWTVFVNQWMMRSIFSRLRHGVFVLGISSFRGVELYEGGEESLLSFGPSLPASVVDWMPSTQIKGRSLG